MEQRQTQNEEPAIDVKTLQQLSSKREDERRAAEESLESLGSRKVDELLAVLREGSRKRRRNRRVGIYVAVGYTGIFAALLIGYVVHGLLSGHWGHYDPSMFSQFGAFGALGSAAAFSAAQKNATKKLAEVSDVRAVGPLAEALESGDRDLQATVEGPLIEMLPRLRASDAHLLDDQQRAALYRVLKSDNTRRIICTRFCRRTRLQGDKRLIIAILQAMAQVGDEKALPHVEKLAEGAYPAGQDSSVQAEAKECLPFLRARVEQERAAQKLLRAATSPDSPSEVLLRPAHGSSPSDPAVLLRPSASDELA